jgi:hypothetical protein
MSLSPSRLRAAESSRCAGSTAPVLAADARQTVWAAVTVALVSVLVAGLVGCSSTNASSHGAVLVTVDLGHEGASVPGDFLGLSFETSVLGSDLFDPARSNLPALMRDLGGGRLRFGGNSADRVAAWTPDPAAPLPPWARSRVDPEELARLGALAVATGWKIDLAVTLGHPDPTAAAGEVAAAEHLVGGGFGTVQVGNEPDLLGGVRPGYGEAGYRRDVASYRASISAAAPGAALSGPGTANPGALASYAADEDAGLAFLTQHFYPLTRCGGTKPTVGQLLSSSTLERETRLAATAVEVGRANGLAVRLDETNSASCGGQDGVSNTLASALWIVEYLVTAAQSGVSGVGIQGGLAACRGYSPLCVAGVQGPATGTAPGIDTIADASLGAAFARDGRLAAQPDFYGMLLVHELEGGRWLAVTTDRAATAWVAALKMPDGAVRVVIVNPSPDAAADITVRVPGYAVRAAVQWLTGPSLTATSGVQFSGATVDADGAWRPLADSPLPDTGASVRVHVRAATAVLLTVSLRS